MYAFDYEEVVVAGTVKSLTASKVVECDVARVDILGAPIRYVLHGGAPTPTFGLPSAGEGEILQLNRDEALGLRAIAEGPTSCILRATYYRRP